MKYPLKIALFSMPFLGLAACGGGGAPAMTDPDPAFLSAQSQFFEARSAIAFTDTVLPTPTPNHEIQLVGGATYSGPMLIVVANSGRPGNIALADDSMLQNKVVGDVELTLNFEDERPLSGTVTNFIRSDGTDVAGTLTIAPTRIVRDTTQNSTSLQETQINGSLTNTALGNVSLNGTMIGGFAGPEADIWGEARSTSGTVFRGQFVASEN